MSLTPKDKEIVKTFWDRVSPKAEDIGADALFRMLCVYPQTKTYFSHWQDMGPNSVHVRKHGAVLMGGVTDAVAKMDNMVKALLTLSEHHVYTLRVDPANFKLLGHNLMVVLAIMYPTEFTAEVHVSFDKFLAALARALSEKYR